MRSTDVPRLSVDTTNRVANYGVEQGLRKGTRLFERGQRGVDFFLVLEGNIEVRGGICSLRRVFVMLGAEPNTELLDGCLALDARGSCRQSTAS